MKRVSTVIGLLLLMIVPAETDSSKTRAEELVLDTNSIASRRVAKRLLMFTGKSISEGPVKVGTIRNRETTQRFPVKGTGNRRVAFGGNGFCLYGG